MGNKKKIINDPVHGFITIQSDIVFDIIENPYFQRLRRIKQLGMTSLVYPGALHTRFQHALGAMHLMCNALDVLKQKGIEINEAEYEGASLAILLHDIGHGPFSHSLENSLVTGLTHEEISMEFFKRLNEDYNGRFSMAIEIFNGTYHKKFLSMLVSSQLDVDRIDYLKRDSFFTGVQEGSIGSERIIKMLNVSNQGRLVVEHKGIYSVENFLIARKLMYWQVYHHKTVLSAEQLLIRILKRAKQLASDGIHVPASKPLSVFIDNNIETEQFSNQDIYLHEYSKLDDYDLFAAVKQWSDHSDSILALLSSNFINRKLYKIILQKDNFDEDYVNNIKDKVKKQYQISDKEIGYLVFTEKTSTSTYNFDTEEGIGILQRDGSISDFADNTDESDYNIISKPITKHYLCYPKNIV